MSRHRIAICVALAMTWSACSSGNEGRLPPPKVTSSTVDSTTTVPDFSNAPLPAVDGTTTTSLAISGRSTIRGTVNGPDGAVAGATVRIERIVLGAVQRNDVPTDEAGAFELVNHPGGAFRVRAFLAPTLALVQPEVFLLRSGETKELGLRLEAFEGVHVAASATPGTPLLDEPVNVVVQVAERRVDDDGVVRTVPLPDVLVRLVPGRWELVDPEEQEQLSNGNGQVLFELVCRQPGGSGTGVTLGDDSEIVRPDLPACVDPSTTTTTGGDSTTTSAG